MTENEWTELINKKLAAFLEKNKLCAKTWKAFTEMLEKEVQYSRLMEEMLREGRSKKRKRYYMLQKQLVLKGSEE